VLFHVLEVFLHFFDKGDRICSFVRPVVGADFGGDGEAGGHRQLKLAGHFGEVGAFAAEQLFHRTVTIGFTVAEIVDALLDGFLRRFLNCSFR